MKYVAGFLLFLFAISTLTSQSATAQGDKVKCDLATITKQIAAFKPSGDDKTDMAALLKLRDAISQADATCNGMTFSGKNASKAIGPFVLPAGAYKFTAYTTGYLALTIKLADPSCDKYEDDTSVALVQKGEGDTGKESILTINSTCKIYLQPSLADQPWRLTIEPLNSDATPVADAPTDTALETEPPTDVPPTDTVTPAPTYTKSVTETPAGIGLGFETKTPVPVEPTETPAPTLSAKDRRAATATAIKVTAAYLADFKPIDRRELVAYPNRHKGEQMLVQGRIFHIIDDRTFQIYLANSYDAAVIVSRDELQGLYENTFVKIYGVGGGTWTGTNAYGADIVQPLVYAAFIKKQ